MQVCERVLERSKYDHVVQCGLLSAALADDAKHKSPSTEVQLSTFGRRQSCLLSQLLADFAQLPPV